MIKRVEEYIRQHNMIEAGDTVVAGISGGADSVCLLHVLKKLSVKMDFELVAVHVNHMIRGEEADGDEAYVRAFCEKIGVSPVCHKIDVPKIAKETGTSLEEAGRTVRYRCFNEAGVGSTSCKVAVAHHADDMAETVLHNIVRGSSIKGAGGIRPVYGNIVRPLLAVRRAEIEAYLADLEIDYCTDSTNLSVEYTRNRIRMNIIPELSKVNLDAVSNINDFANDMRECYEFVGDFAQRLFDEVVCRRDFMAGNGLTYDKLELAVGKLATAPSIVRREVIMRAIAKCSGSLKDITRKHIESVDELIFMDVSKGVDLPYGIRAERGYETLLFRKNGKADGDNTTEMEGFEPELELSVEDFDGDWEKLTNDYTKVFDYAKIKGGLILRKRQPGDFLVIDDAGHKKSLKSYFIDEKIPVKIRDKVWLVAEGSHILWVVGYRTGCAYKTDNNTKKILKVALRRNGYDI